MNDINKHVRKVNGQDVTTKLTSFALANIMSVEVGTNGLKGGDSGHGSRTYLKIMDELGSDMQIRSYSDEFGGSYFEVILGGDCELKTFIDSLKFAVSVLEDGINR